MSSPYSPAPTDPYRIGQPVAVLTVATCALCPAPLAATDGQVCGLCRVAYPQIGEALDAPANRNAR